MAKRNQANRIAAPLTKGSAKSEGVSVPGRRKEDDENLVVVSELGASSQESEDSTSGSSEQDTESSSNASPTPTDDESSPDTGWESRASRTWRMWEPVRSLLPDGATDEGRYVPKRTANAVHGSTGTGSTKSPLLTSSVEASPAKISPSPASGRGSTASDRASSSSSHGSQMTFSGAEDGSSLRTYPDYFPPTVAEISQSYLRRWPSSGFTTSPGECLTADTSECPSEGAVSSSLPDVLEADVHPRFYLSQKAAAGILRRAERRGKALPGALRMALTQLAASQPPSDGTERPKTSSLGPSKQMEVTGRELTTTPTSVRRLSPTETERLQGFPDGWTSIPQLAVKRAEP